MNIAWGNLTGIWQALDRLPLWHSCVFSAAKWQRLKHIWHTIVYLGQWNTQADEMLPRTHLTPSLEMLVSLVSVLMWRQLTVILDTMVFLQSAEHTSQWSRYSRTHQQFPWQCYSPGVAYDVTGTCNISHTSSSHSTEHASQWRCYLIQNTLPGDDSPLVSLVWRERTTSHIH